MNKLAHPLFLFSLLLLALNDWIFKTTFHNAFTGKLSDFAGLFAFPFLLSALFPRYVNSIHALTAMFFICWKAAFSQPLIDFINQLSLPIGRTVDFTDNLALFCIPLSYFLVQKRFAFSFRPILAKSVLLFSCFTFMATTMVHPFSSSVPVNKVYPFEFSRKQLISRFNMVQIQEIYETNKISGNIHFDSEKNTFHYSGYDDTLALIIDHVRWIEVDTIRIRNPFAEIKLAGNDHSSSITLVRINIDLKPNDTQEKRLKKTIRLFEKRVIRKINHYR